jgi:triphosphoribosyl-dephospho-CoA synthase
MGNATDTIGPAVAPRMTSSSEQRIAHARSSFIHACTLDVAVRKPGNVSHASPGHGMQAQQFLDSAAAAAGPLFEPGVRVGARIEAAMAATWAAVGCNTNLGILLLCAPMARAIETAGSLDGPDALRAAVEAVLADLDIADAAAAYRAIRLANPAGLGHAPAQDVHAAPSLGLRDAMTLAADRDRIAHQYASGYADLFELALPLVRPAFEAGARTDPAPPSSATARLVQRAFMTLLGAFPDSHIVRKHGEAVAHTVMTTAQGMVGTLARGDESSLADWDDALKAQRVNPGTSADLTVAALLLGGVLAPPTPTWHGS